MLKLRVLLGVVICASFISSLARAESVNVSLKLPDGFAATACAKPLWTGVKAVWEGVEDQRESKEIGKQTQKDKDPIIIMSEPPLDKVFDPALKDIFTACGIQFVKATDDDDAVLKISADIRDFSADVEKKLVSSKGGAESSIAIHGVKNGQTNSIIISYGLSSKNVRSGNIKQIEKTLNALFLETLKQIVATQEIQNLK